MLDGAVILLNEVVQVLVLANLDRCRTPGVERVKRGQIGAALVHCDRFELAVLLNRLLEVTARSGLATIGALIDSSMIERRIARSPRLVVGTPAYFERAGIPKSPADLARHQAIVYARRGGGEAWLFSRSGSEVAVAISGRLRVSAAEGMRTAVSGGMGLAVASRWMFSPELASGTAQAVLTDWELPPIDLWAVFPAGSRRRAAACSSKSSNRRWRRANPQRRNDGGRAGAPVLTNRGRRSERRLADRRAAVDVQRLPRHEARVVRQQERDRRGEFVGLAEVPYRDCGKMAPLAFAARRIVRSARAPPR